MNADYDHSGARSAARDEDHRRPVVLPLVMDTLSGIGVDLI